MTLITEGDVVEDAASKNESSSVEQQPLLDSVKVTDHQDAVANDDTEVEETHLEARDGDPSNAEESSEESKPSLTVEVEEGQVEEEAVAGEAAVCAKTPSSGATGDADGKGATVREDTDALSPSSVASGDDAFSAKPSGGAQPSTLSPKEEVEEAGAEEEEDYGPLEAALLGSSLMLVDDCHREEFTIPPDAVSVDKVPRPSRSVANFIERNAELFESVVEEAKTSGGPNPNISEFLHALFGDQKLVRRRHRQLLDGNERGNGSGSDDEETEADGDSDSDDIQSKEWSPDDPVIM